MTLFSLLAQTVQIEAYTGTTYTGDPSYNTAVSADARVEGRVKRVLDEQGVERQTTATVYTAIEVSAGDRVTLPDGDSRIAMTVNKVVDQTGTVHHYEVDL